MAKKMKRGGHHKGKGMKRSSGRHHGHHSPSPKQRQNYYRLIEKGAERTLSTLAKHNPKAAERIVAKVM